MTKEKPKEKPFLQRIKLLDERITTLEEKIKAIEERNIPAATPSVTPEQLFQSKSQNPIPMEYREIIDTVLNHSFGITIDPLPDRPAFMLNIIVPEKYSNMDANEKAVKKVDLRAKIIHYAEGSNGVRQYAELIANNLGPELRANIIADRALLI